MLTLVVACDSALMLSWLGRGEKNVEGTIQHVRLLDTVYVSSDKGFVLSIYCLLSYCKMKGGFLFKVLYIIYILVFCVGLLFV